MPTIIDSLYCDYVQLSSFLAGVGEISFRISADSTFRKSLLLSVASFFEERITQTLLDFCTERSQGNELVGAFIKNKAISRQFHTFFSWNQRNANAFFGLFGDGFRTFMKKEVATSDKLDAAVSAFLQLGEARNQLVHLNFAIFPLEKTAAEIYELYERAMFFVEALPSKLREYRANPTEE